MREVAMNASPKGTESVSSQIRRIAIGGFPDDPREVARLNPLLRFFKLEEDMAELQRALRPKMAKRFRRIPHQSLHLEQYFDRADLTKPQRRCMSLFWEYGLSKAEIAHHMGKHRSVVQGHIRAAYLKLSRVSGLRDDLERAIKGPRT
jgi:DNA-binding CsgD family transcriptional regulator